MKRVAVLGIAIAVACTPIRPVPLSSAPVNSCPCDAYDATQSNLPPTCDNGRCEISTAGNRPAFPFWIVVNVPTTSIYAAGSTYVLYSDEKGVPTFTRKVAAGSTEKCIAPQCVQLGGLTAAGGNYTVSADSSFRVGYPLPDGASIPVRVEYDPLANNTITEPPFPALSLNPTIVFPSLDANTNVAEFAASLPTGIYRRTMYPEAPFDALFPPRTDASETVGVPGAPSSGFNDDFSLDATSLDPSDGRIVTVTRDAGLDGWQASIVDSISQRRISTLKTLAGTSEKVQLDTTGQQINGTTGGGLAANVEVHITPPASFIAVPTFVTSVIGGQQFEIDYPALPAPVGVVGVVAEPTNGDASAQLFGYQARVTFESATIAALHTTQASPLLQYTTVVDTDVRGQFSTLLPPGTYNVTTEPAEGTGFATSRSIVLVDHSPNTAITLQPPLRTKVTGRVLLTDGRPLADADILALPQTPDTKLIPKPRAGRSHTANDGSYEIELDQGPFVFTVVPKVGSGFPRVVTLHQVEADTTDLPDISVPPPTPLSFSVRDPTKGVETLLPNAIVQIFTIPDINTGADLLAAIKAGTLQPPVEIGESMTDSNGLVEILLAPGPR